MFGKKLDVILKTPTVVMMYSIFNISTSSQFRTRPYGWCGPSEHAEWQWFCRKWKQAILQLSSSVFSYFSSVFSYFSPVCSYSMQLFSPVFNYSRHYVFVQCYSVILAIMFLYSVIQLFSPCVLSKVQCIYYHALAFQAKSIFAIYWNIS